MVVLALVVIFLFWILCGVAGAGAGILVSAIFNVNTDAASKYGFLWGLLAGIVLGIDFFAIPPCGV